LGKQIEDKQKLENMGNKEISIKKDNKYRKLKVINREGVIEN
jgi:hypothetical protein